MNTEPIISDNNVKSPLNPNKMLRWWEHDLDADSVLEVVSEENDAKASKSII